MKHPLLPKASTDRAAQVHHGHRAQGGHTEGCIALKTRGRVTRTASTLPAGGAWPWITTW
ncbi:MAG: hypothetical protein CM15mP18_0730 [Methanobacteriota archaeon]|nr:MAG: hypothetical protein CM15mP18_0730 [Euryarchaeota archaeon]